MWPKNKEDARAAAFALGLLGAPLGGGTIEFSGKAGEPATVVYDYNKASEPNGFAASSALTALVTAKKTDAASLLKVVENDFAVAEVNIWKNYN